jgi:hypothetical protein
MRQLELIPNDQTRIYTSLVGGSLNASVSNHQTAISHGAHHGSIRDDNITLAGVTNSITAMLDDMLVAYSSAQLKIAKNADTAPTIVTLNAIRFGNILYVYGVFAINSIDLLLVLMEALRIGAWKGLVTFDYTDPMCLIVGGSADGRDIAQRVGEFCCIGQNGDKLEAVRGVAWARNGTKKGGR